MASAAAPRVLLDSADGRARIWVAAQAITPAAADATLAAILRDTEWRRVETGGRYDVGVGFRDMLPEMCTELGYSQVSLRLYESGEAFDTWRTLPAGGGVVLWLGKPARHVHYGPCDSDRMLLEELAGHGTAHVFEGDAVHERYRLRVPRRPKHLAPRVAVLFYD